MGNNDFVYCKALTSVRYAKATSIGQQVFLNCNLLNNVNLDSLEHLGKQAFANCTDLNDIYAPILITISQKSFSNCYKLFSVNFVSVEVIEEDAFTNCTKLEKLDFSNLKQIKSGAFSNCLELESVIAANLQSIDQTAFVECGQQVKLITRYTVHEVTGKFPTPYKRNVILLVPESMVQTYDKKDDLLDNQLFSYPINGCSDELLKGYNINGQHNVAANTSVDTTSVQNNNRSLQTGDISNIIVCVGLFLVSGVLVTFLTILLKKKFFK